MKAYLDKAIDGQMAKERSLATSTPDEVFKNDPDTALKVVDKIRIGPSGAGETIVSSCRDYISLGSGLMQSLEFDMKMMRFIQKPIVEILGDYVTLIHRQRAYFAICKKITGERQ